MGNLNTILRKVPTRTSAVVAMIAAAVIIPAALFAWGPDRATYTTEHPADHVVFNSITNNPSHGDERNFVQVRESTASNTTYVDSISLSAGKEYVIYMYYHNNAASNLNASGVGIAHDATVRAEVPAIVPNGSNGTKAVGYVSASNAAPQTVWDDVSFQNTTGGDIALRMVPGSATIHNFGKTNGATLGDSIVTSGTKIGFDALDGTVPGCNEFAGYVTFRVKADQANFTVTKQVRKTGTTSWQKTVAAQPGDSVDYLVTYANTGTTSQNDVVVNDLLPTGLSYVAGTTKVANATNPSGLKVGDNITKGGINIGNYNTKSNAYVMFSAKVADNDQLPTCGVNTLHNVVKLETNNGTKQDTADVTTTKQCVAPKQIQICDLKTKTIVTINENQFDSAKHSKNVKDCATTPVTPVTPTTPVAPAQLPHTGAGENIGAALSLGTIIASASYYVASRRGLLSVLSNR
jgi:uncharacterized repeat protein (TIGR01451 family)